MRGLGSVLGLGRFPGEGKGYPLQYSGIENSMDCIIHGVTKSQTQLSDFHLIFLNSSHCLLFKAPPHLIFPNSVNDTVIILSSIS